MASRTIYHHLEPQTFTSPFAMSEMSGEYSPNLRPSPLATPREMFDVEMEGLKQLRRADSDLKQRIRRLRVISRILSLLLAIAAFVPLAITLSKFLSTRNDYRNIPTTSGATIRTAWAFQTRAWPTYMYFSIALMSLLLNSAIVMAYIGGVKAANITARIGTVFTIILILMDIGIWTAAVIIYKVEKDILTDGKHTDIWGWTCSPAAREIQGVFTNVPFNQYCNIQTAGWAAGLLEVAVLGSSAIVYWYVWRRSVNKEMVRKRTETAQLIQASQSR